MLNVTRQARTVRAFRQQLVIMGPRRSALYLIAFSIKHLLINLK
jgi:hypothetical protein